MGKALDDLFIFLCIRDQFTRIQLPRSYFESSDTTLALPSGFPWVTWGQVAGCWSSPQYRSAASQKRISPWGRTNIFGYANQRTWSRDGKLGKVALRQGQGGCRENRRLPLCLTFKPTAHYLHILPATFTLQFNRCFPKNAKCLNKILNGKTNSLFDFTFSYLNKIVTKLQNKR